MTKDTQNLAALEALVRRFGDTYYGDLADVRLAELKQADTARQLAESTKKADEEARAKAESEGQRLGLLQKEEERRAKAKRKTDEAERQRLALLQQEEERRAEAKRNEEEADRARAETLTSMMAPPSISPSAKDTWVELGCKQVGRDRDTVPLFGREGQFKALRLYVRGADIEMRDLKVIFENGEPQDIPVRHLIRQGERTRPGWSRSINRVDLFYRTGTQGITRVCVEGLRG